jgi:hypothetical protein
VEQLRRYRGRKHKSMPRELTLREKILIAMGIMWLIILGIIAISYYTIPQ